MAVAMSFVCKALGNDELKLFLVSYEHEKLASCQVF
jgi:hypothetical protein